MPASRPLQIGWLSGFPNVKVELKASGLRSHTAIIAQSGAGKSFALGRLLEEIVARTRARLLILDPNSDFAKFSEVAPERWKDSRFSFASDDWQLAFERSWEAVGFDLMTNRASGSLQLKHPKAQVYPISISWPDLPVREQARYLGLSARRTPEGFFALSSVRSETIRKEWARRKGERLTLANVQKLAYSLWMTVAAPEKIDAELDEIFAFGKGLIAPRAALAVAARCEDLQCLDIWDRAPEPQSLPAKVRALTATDAERRVLGIDLGSLDAAEAVLSATSAALSALWDATRRNWIEAMQKSPEEDSRCPIFVVVDEAHNLAPARPEPVLAKSVNDQLVRIATEGRKYGLFLILVTQRPNRLEPSLLSQCDSLCLMKMNNEFDLQLVEREFGFIPPGWPRKALNFERGDAMLAGSFVKNPVYARLAPRRTAEGGRDLRDEAWLEDPLPAQPPAQ